MKPRVSVIEREEKCAGPVPMTVPVGQRMAIIVAPFPDGALAYRGEIADFDAWKILPFMRLWLIFSMVS